MKTIQLFAASVVVVAALTGCSDKKAEEKPAETAATTPPTAPAPTPVATPAPTGQVAAADIKAENADAVANDLEKAINDDSADEDKQ
jgi:hypothetical protein